MRALARALLMVSVSSRAPRARERENACLPEKLWASGHTHTYTWEPAGERQREYRAQPICRASTVWPQADVDYLPTMLLSRSRSGFDFVIVTSDVRAHEK